jgi:hypothetical protein
LLPVYRKRAKRRLSVADKFYFNDAGVANFSGSPRRRIAGIRCLWEAELPPGEFEQAGTKAEPEE